jgi:hypothetical protein
MGPMPRSRRCSLCGISFPSHYGTCRVCKKPMDPMEDPPDKDWQEKAKQAKAELVATEEAAKYDAVREWRRTALEKAGYADEVADALAGRPDVDLRVAENLMARGCSERMALRILL